MLEEARRIITTVRQMQASLDGRTNRHSYQPDDEELRISYPLTKCLQILKEKHQSVSREHRARFEQVQSKFPAMSVCETTGTNDVAELVIALESYSSHLESSFVKISLPPTDANASVPPTFDLSPNYVTELDDEFTRVYEEYQRRVETIKELSEHIINLWAELGTPQAQQDSNIIKYYRDQPEQLGLHEEDIMRLRSRRDKLSKEKENRERHLQELKLTVTELWDKLGIDEGDRKAFLNSNRGVGVRQINEFEDELARLHDLKRKNLHLFVEDTRYKLQELWDGLYFSEEEMLDFTPAFSDVYSDALLEAHEQEIKRLEALKEQRAPMLTLIDRHRELIKEREDLASASQDASRLMMRGQKGEKRDPTRLLREEKMRKRIAKELPKLTIELRKALEKFADEYGRPFMVHGESYLDELEAAEQKVVPTRSRTPAATGATIVTTTKTVPTKKGSTASLSRANSMARPPTRNGAKTPTAGDTIRRGASTRSLAQSTSTTPSRLPARAPLSSLPQGNVSPVRRAQSERQQAPAPNSRAGLMGPPDRAPPPKMRQLFEAPDDTPTPAGHYRADSIPDQYRSQSVAHLYRSQSVESNPHAVVRAVQSEDPYDEPRGGNTIRGLGRAFERPYSDTSSSSHNSSTRQDDRYNYPPPAIIRQTSHTSTAATSVVSDNWETYDSDPEEEPERSEEYHRRLAIAKQQKEMRGTPEGYPPRHLAGSALERTRSPPMNGRGSVMSMGGSVRGFPPQQKPAIRPVPTFDERGERIFSNDTNWTDATDNF